VVSPQSLRIVPGPTISSSEHTSKSDGKSAEWRFQTLTFDLKDNYHQRLKSDVDLCKKKKSRLRLTPWGYFHLEAQKETRAFMLLILYIILSSDQSSHSIITKKSNGSKENPVYASGNPKASTAAPS